MNFYYLFTIIFLSLSFPVMAGGGQKRDRNELEENSRATRPRRLFGITLTPARRDLSGEEIAAAMELGEAVLKGRMDELINVLADKNRKLNNYNCKLQLDPETQFENINILHLAAIVGDYKMVEMMMYASLEHPGFADVLAKSDFNIFYIAAKFDHVNVVEVLHILSRHNEKFADFFRSMYLRAHEIAILNGSKAVLAKLLTILEQNPAEARQVLAGLRIYGHNLLQRAAASPEDGVVREILNLALRAPVLGQEILERVNPRLAPVRIAAERGNTETLTALLDSPFRDDLIEQMFPYEFLLSDPINLEDLDPEKQETIWRTLISRAPELAGLFSGEFGNDRGRIERSAWAFEISRFRAGIQRQLSFDSSLLEEIFAHHRQFDEDKARAFVRHLIAFRNQEANKKRAKVMFDAVFGTPLSESMLPASYPETIVIINEVIRIINNRIVGRLENLCQRVQP